MFFGSLFTTGAYSNLTIIRGKQYRAHQNIVCKSSAFLTAAYKPTWQKPLEILSHARIPEVDALDKNYQITSDDGSDHHSTDVTTAFVKRKMDGIKTHSYYLVWRLFIRFSKRRNPTGLYATKLGFESNSAFTAEWTLSTSNSMESIVLRANIAVSDAPAS